MNILDALQLFFIYIPISSPQAVTGMVLGEQAARTDISQAFNSWDRVCRAGIRVSRESRADCTLVRKGVEVYSGNWVSQVGEVSG